MIGKVHVFFHYFAMLILFILFTTYCVFNLYSIIKDMIVCKGRNDSSQ